MCTFMTAPVGTHSQAHDSAKLPGLLAFPFFSPVRGITLSPLLRETTAALKRHPVGGSYDIGVSIT